MSTIVIRADAGASIGIGHVMRCITLGAALSRAGCIPILVSRDLPDQLSARAASSGLTLAPLEPLGNEPDSELESVLGWQPDFVVVDGYHLDGFVQELGSSGVGYGVIDDNGELPTAGARLVLNQNLHATRELYAGAQPHRLLLGSDYALIREDVTSIRRPGRSEPANRVLVSLGGADPLELTHPIVTMLLDESEFELRVAVGAANPARPRLMDLLSRHSRAKADRGDLVESMGWADAAVIGAGTTLWEVGHLGLPSIAVIAAENQIHGARAAQAAGFVDVVDLRRANGVSSAVSAMIGLLSNPARRLTMAESGVAMFDGLGAERVASAVIELANAQSG